MKSLTHPVKIREAGPDGKKVSREVGIATYAEYDTVAEALDNLGEEKTLELINSQARTNELNRVRGLNRPGGISKTALRNEAMQVITGAEWMSVAGDKAKMDALIEAKMEEIKAEKISSNGGGADDSDDEN